MPSHPTVKIKIGIDLDNDLKVGKRIAKSARKYYKDVLGLKLNKKLTIPLKMYYIMDRMWRGFLVFDGHGDIPPEPE